jgi:16S rRNA (cytidine1402-2'-O)-methyltransferase
MLYLVATPIGNLKDITLRAVETLKSVDLIACEDTRRTKILLDHYGISASTTSFFQHNRFVKGEYLLGLLTAGKSVALVSDAGTPGILDPGYNLINAAVAAGVSVCCIPGPTALVAALVSSGKPAHEFYFAGFLPPKLIARRNKIAALLKFECTIICYESCHRIVSALADIRDIDPDRLVVVCRELTKKFEEIMRGSARELALAITKKSPKGEYVIVF